jgi:hypothetical protein
MLNLESQSIFSLSVMSFIQNNCLEIKLHPNNNEIELDNTEKLIQKLTFLSRHKFLD